MSCSSSNSNLSKLDKYIREFEVFAALQDGHKVQKSDSNTLVRSTFVGKSETKYCQSLGNNLRWLDTSAQNTARSLVGADTEEAASTFQTDLLKMVDRVTQLIQRLQTAKDVEIQSKIVKLKTTLQNAKEGVQRLETTHSRSTHVVDVAWANASKAIIEAFEKKITPMISSFLCKPTALVKLTEEFQVFADLTPGQKVQRSDQTTGIRKIINSSNTTYQTSVGNCTGTMGRTTQNQGRSIVGADTRVAAERFKTDMSDLIGQLKQELGKLEDIPYYAEKDVYVHELNELLTKVQSGLATLRDTHHQALTLEQIQRLKMFSPDPVGIDPNSFEEVNLLWYRNVVSVLAEFNCEIMPSVYASNFMSLLGLEYEPPSAPSTTPSSQSASCSDSDEIDNRSDDFGGFEPVDDEVDNSGEDYGDFEPVPEDEGDDHYVSKLRFGPREESVSSTSAAASASSPTSPHVAASSSAFDFSASTTSQGYTMTTSSAASATTTSSQSSAMDSSAAASSMSTSSAAPSERNPSVEADYNAYEGSTNENTTQTQDRLTVEKYVLPSLEKNAKRKPPKQEAAYMGQIQTRGDITKHREACQKVLDAHTRNIQLKGNIESLQAEIQQFLPQIRELEGKIQALKSGEIPTSSVGGPPPAPRSGIPTPPPPPQNGVPKPPPFPRSGIPIPPPPGSSPAPVESQLSEENVTKIQQLEEERGAGLEKVSEFYSQLESLDNEYEENLQIITSILFPGQKISLEDQELAKFVARYTELAEQEIERLTGLMGTNERTKAASLEASTTEAEPEKPWAKYQQMVGNYDAAITQLKKQEEINGKLHLQIQKLQAKITEYKALILEHRLSQNIAEKERYEGMLKSNHEQVDRFLEQYKTRNTAIVSSKNKLKQFHKALETFVGETGTKWTDLKPKVLEKIAKLESGEIQFGQVPMESEVEVHKPLRKTSAMIAVDQTTSSGSSADLDSGSSFSRIERQRLEKESVHNLDTRVLAFAKRTIRETPRALLELNDKLDTVPPLSIEDAKEVEAQIAAKKQECKDAEEFVNYYSGNTYDQEACQRFIQKHT